jgi:PAS domain S-box-containing protein
MLELTQRPVTAFLASEPASLAEAEAILRSMARAVTLDRPDFNERATALDPGIAVEPKTAPVAALPQTNHRHESWGEQTFRNLVESAPDALVMIDREGTIALVNAQTEKLFGYRRDELIGQKVEILVPKRFRGRHPEYRDRFFTQPAARPMGTGLELSGRRKDGRDFPVEISLSPITTERGVLITASVRDITERKRLEARYRTLVEGIPAVTFMAALDEGNNEFYVSPQIETMLGFSQREWLGDPFLWHRQLHPDDRQRWGEEFARTCASGVNFSSEYRFISRDHREVWVHGEARIVRDESGRPLFLQGIAFDITASKLAEKSLRQSAEELERKVSERTAELQEASLRAELASQSRASFLANMSHEIRTPLNGIIGFADLMRRGAETNAAERSEWLEIIHHSGKHLLSLINDILDLSKVDAGKLSVEMVRCSPGAVIDEVCLILAARAEEKGLQFKAVFAGLLPETIETDPTRLRQVLLNIAGNAIKFTHEGQVQITTRLRQPVGGNPMLAVEIADTGIGIPADQLESIFDPFTQADSSITRKFGGTGLGLAISRRLAVQLGGGVTVQSEVGRGTTFTCEFAVGSLDNVRLIEHRSGAKKAGERPSLKSAHSLRNQRVLVVDDGDTNRRLIELVLGRAGAQVKQAENGQQGVERALSESFDIILMDMQMPVMDGYTATQKLRARGITTPIIAMTANAMKGDELKCLQAGCTAYLPKPIDHEQLFSQIAAVVRGNGDAGSAEKTPAPAAAESAQSAPLRSTLPTDDVEFRDVVRQFVERLREKLVDMRSAISAGDRKKLAEHAHWLKGTSGTVGFPAFIAPAKEIERLAKAGRDDGFEEIIAALEEMRERIVFD